MTHLVLVRHGETAWNAEGRVQGHTDVPLNDVGHAQARAVADALAAERFDAVYCSDLARVRDTAAPAAQRLGHALRLDARLRERHYGMFETLTYAEVREQHPQAFERFRSRDPDFDFESGESLRTFLARALDALNDIASRHADERVLVFTHGGVLEMAYRHARRMPLAAPRDFEIPNAALNRFHVGPSGWEILAWAERAHLEGALDDLRE